MLNTTNTNQIAIQTGCNMRWLQQFLIQAERFCEIFVTLQIIFLMITAMDTKKKKKIKKIGALAHLQSNYCCFFSIWKKKKKIVIWIFQLEAIALGFKFYSKKTHTHFLLSSKMRYLLFGRVDDSEFDNFRDDLFCWPLVPFVCNTFAGDALLFIVVIVNNRCILTFNARCQAIFVIVPEQVQKLQVGNFGWIVIDWNHLNVITPVNWKEKKNRNANVLKFQLFLFFTLFFSFAWKSALSHTKLNRKKDASHGICSAFCCCFVGLSD